MWQDKETTIQELLIASHGRLVISVDGRGVTQWRNYSDGKLLLNFFPHVDGKRWVLWTPSGYYDASPGGEELVGWHINRGAEQVADFFPIELFRDRFYRPDIVNRVLDTLDEAEAVKHANQSAGRSETNVAVTDVLPPALQLVQTRAKFDQVIVPVRLRALTMGNAPVSDWIVEINGVVAARAESKVKMEVGGIETITLRLPPKDCDVTIRAKNRHGESSPLRLHFAWAGDLKTFEEGEQAPTKIAKPKLWVVAVGVSQYASKPLSFAHRDAPEFARILEDQAGKSYAEVNVKVLPNEQATRANILASLDWLRANVRAGDVGMLFLSGHGFTQGGDNRYYFGSVDVDLTRVAETGVADSAIREALMDLNNRGNATRAFLFIDTCHAAGSSTEALGISLKASNADDLAEQFRKKSKNIFVFASSSGEESSWESKEYGHGAFTQALIEGMGPLWRADPDGDGSVTALGLANYVSNRVRRILKHDRQNPALIGPAGAPLGWSWRPDLDGEAYFVEAN